MSDEWRRSCVNDEFVEDVSEVGATREVGPGPVYSNDVRKATDLMQIVTGSKINSHSGLVT